MKRQIVLTSLFLLAGAFLLTTCHREYFELDRLSDEVELQAGLVAPLVYGSMNVRDIVDLFDSAEFINEYDDGLLYVAYSEMLVELMADTLVDVQDELVTETYIEPDINTPEWMGSQVGDTVPFYKRERFTVELDGDDRLDSVLVKGGEIVIDVTSSFKHTGLLTISSSQILNVDRDTFSTVIEISDPSGTFSYQQRFDSDGYCLKSKVVNDTNLIEINFKLELINSGNPVDPSDLCEILTNFENMDFYSAYGYIDSRNLIEESGSIAVPLYEENPELASILYRDPRINIFTTNSVGIPFEITLDSVIATAGDGTQVTLEIREGHPFLIAAPGMDQISETVEDTVVISSETSNFNELLNIGPTSLSYKVKGRTDPGSTTHDHFILDESRFSLELEFLLPLDFKSSGFAFRDTLEFAVDQGVDTSLVKYAQVSVATLNELPLELELQVYLVDSLHALVDSVFEEQVILLAASVVDDQGILTQAVEETSTASFPAEKLARLKEVRYMQVEARMITSELGDQYVKIYSHYTLDFEISMSANLRINTREL